MKSINLIALWVVFVLVATGLAKETLVESKWTSVPIRIDGLDNDWNGDTLSFEKNVRVSYALKNDASSLYVLFVFTDRKFLSSIDATGLTIWVNDEGKKKKIEGFKFLRRQVTADELIARLEKQGEQLADQKKAELKSGGPYVLFDGQAVDKDEKPVASVAGARPMPALFRSLPKGNAMVYEFRLPLRNPGEKIAGIPRESAKGLKLGFEWGGLTKEMKTAMADQIQTDDASGSEEEQEVTAPGGGSLSAGFGRGPQKYSFWVDVKLAKNE